MRLIVAHSFSNPPCSRHLLSTGRRSATRAELFAHRIVVSPGFAPFAFFSEPCALSEPCDDKGPKWGARATTSIGCRHRWNWGRHRLFPLDWWTSVFVLSGIFRAILLGDQWPVELGMSIRVGSMVMVQTSRSDKYTLGPAAGSGPTFVSG